MLASKEEGITTASCSEESTIEQDNQRSSVKSKFAYLTPKKETPAEVEVEKVMEDVQTNASDDSTIKQQEEALDEYSFMLQKDIVEIKLQEISSILGEEDKQMDVLNEELQVVTSKSKYEEQFEGALKDLMEEVQMESLPKKFQDKLVASSMIHHQLHPPRILLEVEIPPDIVFKDQLEEIFVAQPIKETLISEHMLMDFHKDAWFMQRDEQDVELFEGALNLFQEERVSGNQHVMNAQGIVHHQWRPPRAADVFSSYDEMVENEQESPFEHEKQQVISFLALNPNFESYYEFDYGDLGRTTCIWFDHGPDELPQLLILHQVLIEYDSCKVRDYLSEVKGKFARLQTMTNALLLLHSLRYHVRSCI